MGILFVNGFRSPYHINTQSDEEVTTIKFVFREIEKDLPKKKFGVHEGKGEYKRLISVKTTDVISIETNGVRAVGVVP